MTTISPEQFLALPPDLDEDESTETPVSADPLTSIADSLRALVGHIEAGTEAERDADAAEARYLELDQAYADLDAKYDVLNDLVEEIRTIIKPSTSKLANSVRAAIVAWSNPEVSDTPEPDPEVVQPAHDADVDEWQAYARSLGYAGSDVDTMNRSQIRTMLGVEQSASA